MAEQKAHFYARTTSSVSRQSANSQSMNQHQDEENGDQRRRIIDEDPDMGTWDAMDLCGQGLRGMAPALFKHYPKLKKIYLKLYHLTY